MKIYGSQWGGWMSGKGELEENRERKADHEI